MSNYSEELMQNLVKKHLVEGIASDLARARTRGEAESVRQGWAEGLAVALASRIGRVPEALRARIRAADPATIQAWCDRAIEATDFESVFDQSTAPFDSVVTSA